MQHLWQPGIEHCPVCSVINTVVTSWPCWPVGALGGPAEAKALRALLRQARKAQVRQGTRVAEYADSPHTLRSYRKEVERLLTWATQVRGKAVSSLAREDVLAYEAFLANPPADWCDEALGRRGDRRRLVTGPLSDRSRRQALGILAGLFQYPVRGGYLAAPPLFHASRAASPTARLAARRAVFGSPPMAGCTDRSKPLATPPPPKLPHHRFAHTGSESDTGAKPRR